MTATVVVVGSLNMDLVVRSPRMPKPGETLLGQDLHTVPGGKGANQAVAAARLGARVSMIGRVGSDSFAAALLASQADAGIDHTWIGQDPDVATGVALIIVDDGGENSIVLVPGANMRLAPQHVDAAEDVIAAADVLLLQLENPVETVTRAASVARQHGVQVILNPAPAQPVPPHLLALVDVLIPNEHETALLSGLPVDDLDQAQEAAGRLQAAGVGAVILTLGGRGALLAAGDEMQHFPAFSIMPVDTTAAGDAFVAGFSVALAEGRPLPEAVRWGNAAGALAATRLGAQPSLPTRHELLNFLNGAR